MNRIALATTVAVQRRLGLFVTTARDGYHGGWRILQATTQPGGCMR